MTELENIGKLAATASELLNAIRGGEIANMKAEHAQTLEAFVTAYNKEITDFGTEKTQKLSGFATEAQQVIASVESLKAQVMSDNNQQLAEFKAKYQGVTALDVLSMPLNKNAFLIADENGNPLHGYAAIGEIQMSAVHPFTKGFEGPYRGTAPTNTASSIATATETSPYFFGRYYKGPRASRGGLADGFHSLASAGKRGHLLKVYKPAGEQNNYKNSVLIPVEHFKRTRVRLRGYVYVAKGALSFDLSAVDSGSQINIPSLGEWHFIDEIVGSSEVTRGYLYLNIDHAEECEMYFAMLNVHAVQGYDSQETLINREF